ncbi:MAG: hypothetical protein QOI31_1590 [Solirubrobacterales bacterium]|jgi:hypothetical protein|nr:hypothetical protein [Solirubrobacterales bacterium]
MVAPTSSTADLGPAQERLLAESRAHLVLGLFDRERTVEVTASLAFIVAATVVAVAWDTPRSLDIPLAVGLMAVYALATRVEFRIASGWTDPSQLVFVPMLFLLPTNTVPFAVAGALLLARIPDYRRGEVHADRAMLRTGDAWYSIWPVLVLLAFGATSPDWSDWPVYLLALAAQFAIDGAMTTLRVSYGLGIKPREVIAELAQIDLIDALLSPAGLLVAFAAAADPWASILVLPLLGVFQIFAKEREARIESARALSGAYRGTAILLSEVLSSTDEYTGNHSRSVVVLAHQVGEALDLDETQLRDLEFGALLHDVGKIAVPNEIINKPGRLTDEEMDVMRTHTVEGEGMLNRIGGVLEQAGVVVRTHHERWDGKGYPDGLAGEEIPIGARVITACDAFNAMTTDRPYRKAMPVEAAIAELRNESGKQFDPRVVETLIDLVEAWGDAEPPG